MFDFICVLATFAVVLLMAAAISAKTGLAAGTAPLFVLAGTMVFYTLFGFFDLLLVAGLAWFALGIWALVWLVRQRKKINFSQLVTPSSVFFVAVGIAVIAYLAIRQPIPMEWDEFSFWSIAPKVVKTTGHMYTAMPGNLRVTTYVPGLILLDHAFQFLGTGFVAWKVFAAYDLLMLAIFAAVFAMLEKKDWAIAAPMSVLCLLTPFLLTVYLRVIYVSTVYMSSYADIPMGLLFGGAVAFYFAQQKKTPIALLGAVLIVTAESLTKDMGFALALIAAALIGFDLLFVEKGEVILFKLRSWGAKIGWCLLLVGGPFAAFFGWAKHMSVFLNVSRFDVGGAEEMGMVQLVFTGIIELFSPNKSEKFVQVMQDMTRAFYADSLSMLSIGSGQSSNLLLRLLNGSGLIIVCVILTLLLISFFCGDRRHKIRTAWFALLSSLGFVAFYIFNAFMYVYVFKDFQAAALVSYNRYIYPYYLGWFLMALALVAIALKRTGPANIARLLLLLIAVGSIWRFTSFVRPQLCIIDYPDSYFSEMRRKSANVAAAKAVMNENDKVFFVSQGDDGMAWFVYYYEFYPILTDYSLGGGTLSADAELTELAVPNGLTEQQHKEYVGMKLTRENFQRYLTDTGCTKLYFDQVDGIFEANYGDLFTDGLAAVKNGETNLYEVSGAGDALRLSPVDMGGVR